MLSAQLSIPCFDMAFERVGSHRGSQAPAAAAVTYKVKLLVEESHPTVMCARIASPRLLPLVSKTGPLLELRTDLVHLLACLSVFYAV